VKQITQIIQTLINLLHLLSQKIETIAHCCQIWDTNTDHFQSSFTGTFYSKFATTKWSQNIDNYIANMWRLLNQKCLTDNIRDSHWSGRLHL